MRSKKKTATAPANRCSIARAIVVFPDPEAPKFPYSRYILDQQKLAARRSGSVRSGWQARVHGFARSDTGLRRAGAVAEGAGKADVSAAIEPAHVARAKRLASSLGLSTNIIPLGCVVLAAWSLGEADSVGLSLIYAGRDNPRTRFMLGLLRRYVSVVAERIPQDTLAGFLTGLSKAVFEGIRLSRPPYLAYEFEEAVHECRREPVVDVLYNQVDQLFGAAQPDRMQQAGDLTTVKIVDDPHFSPDRWRAFREPRLRLVLGGGDQPRLQAIFNAGSVAEDEVRQLVGRAVAIAGVMSPETGDSRIPDLVRSAFAEAAY